MPTRQFDSADLGFGAGEATGGPEPADYIKFALRAARRRKGVVIGMLFACASALVVYFMLQTPLYRAQTRILAWRQQSLPSIVRSSVAEDQPTRAAWEIIHRRENLLELLRLAGLLEAPQEAKQLGGVQGAIARVTDPVSAKDDPLEYLILLLDRRLKVEANELTVGIQLDWPDPQQAYLIVDGALQNFIEARHVQEVTALDEAIAILRGRAAVLRSELDRAIEEARRTAIAGPPTFSSCPASGALDSAASPAGKRGTGSAQVDAGGQGPRHRGRRGLPPTAAV